MARQPCHDGRFSEGFTESVVTHCTLLILCPEGKTALPPADLDSSQSELPFEFIERARELCSLVDLRLQESLLTSALNDKIDVSKTLASWPLRRFRHDGQTGLQAKVITDLTDARKGVSLASKLPSGIHVHGVKDDVIVHVIFIDVRCNHVFVSASRDAFSEVDTDTVSGLSIESFVRVKRLNHMMGKNAALA